MLRFHATIDDLPGAPPPEVKRQIGVAWERARELDMHFIVEGARGRVRAELRRPDGSTAGWLSAGEALALACGDAD